MWSIDRRGGEIGGRVNIWGATITIWARIKKEWAKLETLSIIFIHLKCIELLEYAWHSAKP